jgi:hypothetical protein
MSAKPHGIGHATRPREVRLDHLLGRQVMGTNNRPVGRIEEFRAETRGARYVVSEYAIGVGGLMERLGVGVRALFGGRGGGGYLARWDQIDISDPDHPRLTCPVADLRKLVPK